MITPVGVVPSNSGYYNKGASIGGLALTSSGAIVAAGYGWNGSNDDFAVARYLGDPYATTTTLTSSPNPSTSGQPVIFTATVSAPWGTPTGTVEFWDGTTFLGSATLVTVNGVTTAAFTLSTLSSGTHSAIYAKYDGDANDLGSSSGDLSQTVSG